MDDRDAFFMREAIRLSEQGMEAEDGGPFGAVIVKNDQIIGSGWNRVLKTNDPTAHAEIVAIRDACMRLDDYWLEGCRIYSSCEPCPMCLAAIYWARIDSLHFGASRKDAASIEFDDDRLHNEVCRPAAERSLHTHQCLRNEALQVMQGWSSLEIKKTY